MIDYMSAGAFVLAIIGFSVYEIRKFDASDRHLHLLRLAG